MRLRGCNVHSWSRCTSLPSASRYPTNIPILLLQEATGDRALPIYIGRPEAEAIATALQGVVTKRPMTHDLMRDVLTEVGLVLDHVVITELKDQTFYAELRLRRRGQQLRGPRPAFGRHRPGHPGRGDDLRRRGAARRRRDRHRPGEDDRRTGAEGEELVAEFHEFIEGVRPEDFDEARRGRRAGLGRPGDFARRLLRRRCREATLM